MKTIEETQTISLKRSFNDDLVNESVKKARLDVASKVFYLNSGQQMPVVQFGTYKMKGEECYQATLTALRSGYRGNNVK